MKQLVTDAIVLTRTDYGEADRILTLLTPEYGKLRLLARGVRRVKSKLAGGIELFSVSTVTFVKGRGELGTLVSTRLKQHYPRIVEDIDRTMLGYELIKQLNKATEDETEAGYFELLHHTFAALDNAEISLPLVQFWFQANMLRLGGHMPNLQTDDTGATLQADKVYNFSFEHTAFTVAPGEGQFTATHIKLLRLAFAGHPALVLSQIGGIAQVLPPVLRLVQTLRELNRP